MPWDETLLWTAPVRDDGALGPATLVAGGDGVSVCQPEWSTDGALHYVSDETGWWNLYRRRSLSEPAQPLYPDDAEYGRPPVGFRQPRPTGSPATGASSAP